MFVSKEVLQMCQRVIDISSLMQNVLQTQCPFENMPIDSIGNVSIVS